MTYIIQCTFYYIYALDILLRPGPHLHTPNPLSTPERGLCRGPPPHPGSPSIFQPFNDSKIFVLLINIPLSTRNIIHLTIYYNTLSASYKRYSEKFATLRKIFARRDAQKFFKATLNFSKPPHLQLSANATNSAMHGILPRDARCYLINRKLNNLHCTLTTKYSFTSLQKFFNLKGDCKICLYLIRILNVS